MVGVGVAGPLPGGGTAGPDPIDGRGDVGAMPVEGNAAKTELAMPSVPSVISDIMIDLSTKASSTGVIKNSWQNIRRHDIPSKCLSQLCPMRIGKSSLH